MRKGSTLKPTTRSEPKGLPSTQGCTHIYTPTHLPTHTPTQNIIYYKKQQLEVKTSRKGLSRSATAPEMEINTERRLIFRAPGRLLPSVSDDVAGQKDHFVPGVFRGNESTSDLRLQMDPLSKTSETRFLYFLALTDLELSGCHF